MSYLWNSSYMFLSLQLPWLSFPIQKMRCVYHITGLLTTTFFSLASTTPLAKSSVASLPLPVTELQFLGDKTWAENIAVRSNGQILITRLDKPILQLLDPANQTAPITLHTFNTTTFIGRMHIVSHPIPQFHVYINVLLYVSSRFSYESLTSCFLMSAFLERQILTSQLCSSRYYWDHTLLRCLLCRPPNTLHSCLHKGY